MLQQNILPHFLAEYLKKQSFFLLAIPMSNVILCAYYIFLCEGLFACP